MTIKTMAPYFVKFILTGINPLKPELNPPPPATSVVIRLFKGLTVRPL